MMFTLVHVAGVFLLMGSLTTEGRLHGTKTMFRGLHEDGEDHHESQYVSGTEAIVLSEKELEKLEEEKAEAENQAQKRAEKEAKEQQKAEEKEDKEAEKLAMQVQKAEEKLIKEAEALAKKEDADKKALGKKEAAEKYYNETETMIDAEYVAEVEGIQNEYMDDSEEKVKKAENKKATKDEDYTTGSMSAATNKEDEADKIEPESAETALVEETDEEIEGAAMVILKTEDNSTVSAAAEDLLEEKNTTEEEIEEDPAMEAEDYEEGTSTEIMQETTKGEDVPALARAATDPTDP